MITAAQTALIRKCRTCALILGRGEEFRILFIPDATPKSEIVAMALDGFRSAGLLAFDGAGLFLEPEDGPEAARILKLAAADFLLAALAMKASAPSN